MEQLKNNIDFSIKSVEMRGITKKFGDFTANENIDLTVYKGEIHSLLGENGAGKSTLMNILYGLYKPTSGQILINGKEVIMEGPSTAILNGIGMVHQHFKLVEPFTVTENIVLGMEPTSRWGRIDYKKAERSIQDLIARYGLSVNPQARIQDITVGMQQRVEILKTLHRGAEILILDEPTAVLTPQEIDELGVILRGLTAQGKTVIIITHKLKEIKALADTCTIIRRGRLIKSVPVPQTTEKELAAMMVGREVSFQTPKSPWKEQEIILEVKNLTSCDPNGQPKLKGIDLTLRRGEILGIAGVDGNGQSELAQVLTGLLPASGGEAKLKTHPILNRPVREIYEAGLSSVPEDRQKHGLVLPYSIAENLILQNYLRAPFSKNIWLQNEVINRYAKEKIERFDIRPTDPERLAGTLSGGNQQKVILAREISHNPEVMIAVQPTRGLDVGAIEFVHQALVDQREQGKGVLLISLELEEILNLSDTIAVIYEGQIVKTFQSGEASVEEIGLWMAGGGKNEA